MQSLREIMHSREQHYRLLASNPSDVVWMVDAQDLTYVYLSDTVNDLRGARQGELIGHHVADQLSPASWDMLSQVLAQARESRAKGEDPRFRLEVELRDSQGGYTWAELVARFHQEPGFPLMIVGISRDISDRKRREKEREALLVQLRHTLENERRLARENRVLRGLLPICAHCKKIRDPQGQWWDLEEFIENHSQAQFSHTLCDACSRELYPELQHP